MASAPLQDQSPPDNTSRIVYADDQNVMRSALRRILEKERDFVTQEFSSGSDVIQYLKNHPVDLVLTDIYMDKGSGFDVLRAVRNRAMANDIPVVFVSGEATKDDIVMAIDAGVTDYLLKPFEPTELVTKLRTVLGRYHNPSERDRELRVAESLFLAEKYEEAEHAFTELQRKDPKVPRILAGLAQCNLKQGKADMAEKLLQAATRINGLYFPAYALLADLYFARKDMEQTKEHLLKELSLNGKQPHRRLMLARIYDEEGSNELAFEELRRALVDSPKDEELLLYVADLHFRNKNEDKAVHYYVRTRKNHPDCTRALEGILSVYWAGGKPEKALHMFKDLIRTSPKQKDVLLVKARLHEKQENFGDALADVEAYLAEFPDDIESIKLQVKYQTKLGRLEDALVPLRRILQLAPTHENFSRLALMYLKLKQPATAARYYEQAIARAPGEVKYHFNLGYAWEISKSYEKAKESYEKVLAISPNHTDAQVALERLKSYSTQSQPTTAPQESSGRHFEVGSLERYSSDGSGGKKRG